MATGGHCMFRAPNIAAIQAAFDNNFTTHTEVGASFSLWQDDTEIVSLAGGYQDREHTQPWSAETKVLWWSATKVPATTATLLALDQAGIPINSPVASIWPQFAANGKSDITFQQLLSHQAGLAGIPGDEIDPFDQQAVATALAAMAPLWPPGSAHGYHARTIGYLMDEIVRRTCSLPLGEWWRQQIATPANIDFQIGMTELEAAAVADSLPPTSTGVDQQQQAFYRALGDPESMTTLAFRSPGGDLRPRLMNSIAARSFGFPAMGGIGTASGLAKFYAILANVGQLSGKRYLPGKLSSHLNTPLVTGHDQVLQLTTCFGCGAMLDPVGANDQKTRQIFGPEKAAYGHPGAGGTHAFADPVNRLAFAYGMNQMTPGILPSQKAMALVAATYATS